MSYCSHKPFILKDKNFYIIRHGETQYNKLGLVQGSGIDSNLNDSGRMQASAFYEYFKEIPFDKIYTSQLQRTHQSVAQFINNSLPWQRLEGLNEISWGYKEGRIITKDDDRQYYTMINGWKNGEYTHKVEGGENPLEVQERQKIAWKYIMAHPNETNILICMHGRAMRILLCYLLEVQLSTMDDFPHHNLCLYLIKYNAESGKFTAELKDFTEHLSQLAENAGVKSSAIK